MEEEVRSALAGLLPRLRRFGIALTGSTADADDLVQAACERALRHAAQLRDQARLDGWVYRIMRNIWNDETRARRARRQDAIEAALEIAGDDGEASAEHRMTLGAVRRCLHAMTADHRTVLTLVCVDGMSYREAAEVLGIALGTVMSRLARARQELHQRLAGQDSHDNVTPLNGRAGRLRPRPA